MDYPMLNIETVKEVNGDRILCEWEEAKNDLLGGRLVRPDTHRAAHYTGVILKVGNGVEDEDIEVGKRAFFEQFSGFEKFQSPDGKKRYAFVAVDAVLALIPLRAKIETPNEGYEE
jgi:co-chaperonin GroES (HSP10)